MALLDLISETLQDENETSAPQQTGGKRNFTDLINEVNQRAAQPARPTPSRDQQREPVKPILAEGKKVTAEKQQPQQVEPEPVPVSGDVNTVPLEKEPKPAAERKRYKMNPDAMAALPADPKDNRRYKNLPKIVAPLVERSKFNYKNAEDFTPEQQHEQLAYLFKNSPHFKRDEAGTPDLEPFVTSARQHGYSGKQIRDFVDTYDGADPPEQPTGKGIVGGAKEIGRGLARGLGRGLSGTARAAQWAANDKYAETVWGVLAHSIDKGMEDSPQLFAESKKHADRAWYNPMKMLVGTPEMIGQMAPGLAAGPGGVALQFWGDTAQAKYDELTKKKPDMPEAEKVAWANLEGTAQGLVEELQTIIPFVALKKFIPKKSVNNLIKTAAKAIKPTKMQLATTAAGTYLSELGMETGQDMSSRELDYLSGLEKEGVSVSDIADSLKQNALPVLGMTLAFGAAGGISEKKERDEIQRVLTAKQGGVSVQERLLAIKRIYDEVKKEDKALADQWMEDILPMAVENKPVMIPIDDRYVLPEEQQAIDRSDYDKMVARAKIKAENFTDDELATIKGDIPTLNEIGLSPTDIDIILDDRAKQLDDAQAVLDADENKGPLSMAASQSLSRRQADMVMSKAIARGNDPASQQEEQPATNPQEEQNRIHQENKARAYAATKNRKQEELTPEMKSFMDAYNEGSESASMYPGGPPAPVEQVSDEEYEAFKKKWKAEMQAESEKNLENDFYEEDKKADKILQRKDVPDEVKKQVEIEVEEILRSDPVYKHIAEAKKQGRLNLSQTKQDYDEVTIREILLKHPTLFSKKGKVSPDEFAEEMGYDSLDDMITTFSHAKSLNVLRAEIMKEKLDDWYAADDLMAEESQNRKEWAGTSTEPLTPDRSSVYPASDSDLSAAIQMIQLHPEDVTEKDLSHWTYTARQRAQLRKAYSDAIFDLIMGGKPGQPSPVREQDLSQETLDFLKEHNIPINGGSKNVENSSDVAAGKSEDGKRNSGDGSGQVPGSGGEQSPPRVAGETEKTKGTAGQKEEAGKKENKPDGSEDGSEPDSESGGINTFAGNYADGDTSRAAEELVSSTSRDDINAKLDVLFGTNEEADKAEETGDGYTLFMDLAIDFRADLEHAANNRDTAEVKALLDSLKEEQTRIEKGLKNPEKTQENLDRIRAIIQGINSLDMLPLIEKVIKKGDTFTVGGQRYKVLIKTKNTIKVQHVNSGESLFLMKKGVRFSSKETRDFFDDYDKDVQWSLSASKDGDYSNTNDAYNLLAEAVSEEKPEGKKKSEPVSDKIPEGFEEVPGKSKAKKTFRKDTEDGFEQITTKNGKIVRHTKYIKVGTDVLGDEHWLKYRVVDGKISGYGVYLLKQNGKSDYEIIDKKTTGVKNGEEVVNSAGDKVSDKIAVQKNIENVNLESEKNQAESEPKKTLSEDRKSNLRHIILTEINRLHPDGDIYTLPINEEIVIPDNVLLAADKLYSDNRASLEEVKAVDDFIEKSIADIPVSKKEDTGNDTEPTPPPPKKEWYESLDTARERASKMMDSGKYGIATFNDEWNDLKKLVAKIKSLEKAESEKGEGTSKNESIDDEIKNISEDDLDDLLGIQKKVNKNEKNAADLIKETASMGVKGIDEALTGLVDLFGGSALKSFPAGLSKEDYAKAKPHFEKALASFKEAGKSLKELIDYLLKSLGEAAKPYLKHWVMEMQAQAKNEEKNNATSSTDNLEQDSKDGESEVENVETPIPDETGADRPGDREGVEGTSGSAPGGANDSSSIPDSGTTSGGTRGGTGSGPSGGTNTSSSGVPLDKGDAESGADGIQPDREPSAKSKKADRKKADELNKKKTSQQQKAGNKPKHGDIDDIQEQLPLLYPEQQEDVEFVEARLFGDQNGKMPERGVLLANGTGTGKTFSGMGVIKRFANEGKNRILIVVPGENVANSWIEAGKLFGLDITKLEGVKDRGEGIIVTSYANFYTNNEIVKDNFDLIVADESHKLLENGPGNPTLSLKKFWALTGHERGQYEYALMLEHKLVSKIEKLNNEAKLARTSDDNRQWARAGTLQNKADDLNIKLQEKIRKHIANREEHWKNHKTKALFLSATPFAYNFSLDYAEGFLFHHESVNRDTGLTARGLSPRDDFYVTKLGYRIRYGRLTTPESGVDIGLMQRQLNEELKSSGALRGRRLVVDYDYSREFIDIESSIGNKVDEIMEYTREKAWELMNDAPIDSDAFKLGDGYLELYNYYKFRFDYHKKIRFLEAIKAKALLPRVKKHLALGRKVVIFHGRIQGGSANPFGEPDVSEVNPESWTYKAWLDFKADKRDLALFDIGVLDNPLELFEKEFPDEVTYYNGTISNKDKRNNPGLFNRDNDLDGAKTIIMVQDIGGKEGISLHDTNGKHQRVLLNLGLPVRPTQAIQIEGRIYRVGQQSNAVFEYANTGTNFERHTFAQSIAQRSGGAENLALGNDARSLMMSFIDAFEHTTNTEPSLDQGTGGQEADRGQGAASPFDQAKSLYYSNMRRTQKNKSKEGKDYFPTPEPLGLKMVEWAQLSANDKVLEPSAGHGAIARFFPEETNNYAIERSGTLAPMVELRMQGTVENMSFEDYNVINKFDAVIMNPPYGVGGKTAMEHLDKATKHLKNGGRVIAIVPNGPAFDKRLDKWLDKKENEKFLQTATIELPEKTFERAGTKVRTKILIFDRHDSTEGLNISHVHRRIEADSIEDFFDNIENLQLPDRVPPIINKKTKAKKVIKDAGMKVAKYNGGSDKFNFIITGNTYANLASIKKALPLAKNRRFDREAKGWLSTEDPTIPLAEALINVNGLEPLESAEPTIRYSVKQPEQDPQLSSVHGITADGLKYADDMGGLPVPSIAVVTKDGDVNGFGRITLIGNSNMADPSQNPAFDSDIWSTRYPEAQYKKLKSGAIEKITGGFDLPSPTHYGINELARRGDYEGVFNHLRRSNAAKKRFLEEVKGQKKIRNIMMDAPLSNQMGDLAKRKYIQDAVTSLFSEINEAEKNLDDFDKSQGLPSSQWSPETRKKHDEFYKKYQKAREKLNTVEGQADLLAAIEKGLMDNYTDKYGEKYDQQIKEILIDGRRKNIVNEDGLINYGYIDRLKRDIGRIGKRILSTTAMTKKLDARLKNKVPEYENWIRRSILDPVFGEPFIEINRRKYPYDVEHIAEKMSSQKLVGDEKSLTYNAGKARADAGTRFSSMQHMRNSSWNIGTPEEVVKAREKTNKAIDIFKEGVSQHFSGHDNIFGAYDNAMKAVGETAAALGNDKVLKKKLSRLGFKNVPFYVIDNGMVAVHALQNAPVPYFEVKPQRVVKLDEFHGAVIPKGTSNEIKQILKKHGIQYRLYDDSLPGNEEKRRVVAKLRQNLSNKGKGTLFSKKSPEQTGDTGKNKKGSPVHNELSAPISKGGLGKKALNGLLKSGKLTILDKKDVERVIRAIQKGEDIRKMVAWHGSPHDFDNFSTKYMGTGEDMQAFGWGMYFADSKAVAENYRDVLSDGTVWEYNGKVLDKNNPKDRAILIRSGNKIFSGKKTKEKSIDMQLRRVHHFNKMVADFYNPEEYVTQYENLLEELSLEENTLLELEALPDHGDFKVDTVSSGKLYKVNLAPKEDEYLLWDKTISEQSDTVKNALQQLNFMNVEDTPVYKQLLYVHGKKAANGYRKVVKKRLAALRADIKDGNTSMQYLYNTGLDGITGASDKAKSKLLYSLGIKGNKYLDGFSRDTEEGTYNYVIFNDADVAVDIKYSKNGEIEGFTTSDGRVFLVDGNIEEGEALKVLTHELGVHAALLGFTDTKRFKRIANVLMNKRKLDNAEGRAYRRAFAKVPKDTPTKYVPEETLAYLISDGRTDLSIVKRAIAAFKKFLVEKMGISPKIFSNQDLSAMAISALRAEANKARKELLKADFALNRPIIEQFGQPVMMSISLAKNKIAGMRDFKRWFKGSKVVNEDGTPKVLFHGSDKAGFINFDMDNAVSSGGLHFADTWGWAGTYSERNDPAQTPTGVEIFEDPEEYGFEKEFDEETGEYTFYDGDGYTVLEGLTNVSEVISELDTIETSPHSGIYEVYLNIKDPFHIDWEGRNWSESPVEKRYSIIEAELGHSVAYAYSMEEAEEWIADNKEEDEELSIKEDGEFPIWQDVNDMVRQAHEMGYDGVIIDNIYDDGPHSGGTSGTGSTEYVIFDSKQVKSIYNNGEWSKKTDDIRYSKSQAEPAKKESNASELLSRAFKEKKQAGPKVEKKQPRSARELLSRLEDKGEKAEPVTEKQILSADNQDRWERAISYFADKLDPTRLVQKRYGGTITNDNNYLSSERARGKVTTAEVEKFGKEELQPLLKKLADNGLEIKDLEELAYALHVPERNERMRRVNARNYLTRLMRFQTGKKAEELQFKIDEADAGLDFDERTGDFLEILDSEFMHLDAEEEKLKRQEDLFAERVFTTAEELKGTPERLQAALDKKREKLENQKKLRDEWEYKSPWLSGMTDEDAGEIVSKWQKDSRNKELMKAVNMLAVINQGRLDALYEGGELTKEQYDANTNGYSHYVPLHREGFEDEGSGGTGRPSGPLGKPLKVAKGSLKGVVDILANSVSNRQNAISRKHKLLAIKKLFQLVDDNPSDLWSIEKSKMEPTHDRDGNLTFYPSMEEPKNGLSVKIDGERYTILVDRSNKTMMRMLKNIKDSDIAPGTFIATMGKFTRVLSALNTTLAPEFILTNFIRDIQTAAINMNDTEAKGMAKKISKGIPSAMKSIWLSEMDSSKGGDKWNDAYEDFKKHGGKIGWMQSYETITDLANEIQNDFKLHSKGNMTRKTVKKISNIISASNTAVENAVRLATYNELVQSGKATKERAAEIASNLTVDFTRHGTAGPGLNALYMFANAGIQGNVRMVKAFSRSRKVKMMTLGIIGAGAVMNIVAAVMGGDDDDGVPAYDKIDDSLKQRNIIIMTGKGNGVIKIPMPYGYNVFYNIGDEIGDIIRSSMGMTTKKYKPVEGASRIMTSFANSFNPLAAATLLQAVTPTMGDPIAMVSENKTWFGGPLMPERNPYENVKTPDSERYWSTVSPVSKAIARKVNSLAGGDSIKSSGMLDVSPETLDLIAETFTGSAGKFLKDTFIDLPVKISKGEAKVSDIPFVRKVWGEKSEWTDSKQYRSMKTEVLTLDEQIKAATGQRRKELIKDPLYKMIPFTRVAEKRLSMLRSARKKRVARGLDTNSIDNKTQKIYDKYVQKFNKY